ncbi:hypothetical protein [Microtetraspora malaysiensis]|uniref:hypothetical protein n=1 Tax=Microtetraspora malaysiensis TaxID=161358 RepID=UPI003D941320
MAELVWIEGTEDLVAVARRLKEAGEKGLQKELAKAVRKSVNPIVSDLKGAIKALPVTGARGRGARTRANYDLDRAKRLTEKNALKAIARAGLRDTIARSIRADLKLSGRSPGVKIAVKGQLMPPDQRSLPRNLDQPGGWRHPVWGNRNNWVDQAGRPWWDVTIKPHVPQARRDIIDAANKIVGSIAT